jgi:predicted MFS family arabinose efflux permease
MDRQVARYQRDDQEFGRAIGFFDATYARRSTADRSTSSKAICASACCTAVLQSRDRFDERAAQQVAVHLFGEPTTLTVTGLVADTTPQSVGGRRVVSVLAMLAGALIGGVLLGWVALAAPLWLASALLVACAASAFAAASRPQSQAWR